MVNESSLTSFRVLQTLWHIPPPHQTSFCLIHSQELLVCAADVLIWVVHSAERLLTRSLLFGSVTRASVCSTVARGKFVRGRERPERLKSSSQGLKRI